MSTPRCVRQVLSNREVHRLYLAPGNRSPGIPAKRKTVLLGRVEQSVTGHTKLGGEPALLSFRNSVADYHMNCG